MSETGVYSTLACWSEWIPFAQAVQCAPRSPGVYVVRVGDGPIVYVGMAGERRGQGIRGRLTVYARGRGAVSGLGEAVLNRALADPAWVRTRLNEIDAGHPRTAKGWARAAIEEVNLLVSWTTTPDKDSAAALERQAIATFQKDALWNVRRPKDHIRAESDL